MLYSCRDSAWKIADFGLTVEGSSRGVQTTEHSRGTPCYRAPELLLNPDGKNTFTNKVDIWALGCILFELVFGIKAFKSDLDIFSYSTEHTAFTSGLRIPERTSSRLPEPLSRLFIRYISDRIHEMLDVDVSARPMAKVLCGAFGNLLQSPKTAIESYLEASLQPSRRLKARRMSRSVQSLANLKTMTMARVCRAARVFPNT